MSDPMPRHRILPIRRITRAEIDNALRTDQLRRRVMDGDIHALSLLAGTDSEYFHRHYLACMERHEDVLGYSYDE